MMATEGWKWFNIRDIFSVAVTKPVDAGEIEAGGGVPYITRTALNNGCSGFGKAMDDYKLNKGNCITIGGEGRYAFYQEKDFIAGVNIFTLRSTSINCYNALFICTILNLEVYKYSYGRARNLIKIKNEKIKLPSKEDGSVDWDFMTSFIESKFKKMCGGSYKTSISFSDTASKFDYKEWKDFMLQDLFVFKKGKRLVKGDMTPGDLPFIGAISVNNGVRERISSKCRWEGNCITVNYNGSVGEAFYQEEPFYASDDVNCLYAKGWEMTPKRAMFIATIIKMDRYRFSYGRKWTLDKMKETLIRLPALPDGNVDFEYIDDFIGGLPYSDYL